MFKRRQIEWIGGAVVLIALVSMAMMLFDRHLEITAITYRYAANFAAGHGLVYNPAGAPILSGVVSPAYAVLLAILSNLSADYPTISNLISIIAIGAGAVCLAFLMQLVGRIPALIAAGVYILFPLTWAAIGLETAVWLAVGLAALWAYHAHRGVAAAVLLAIMVLIRVEGLILALMVLADAFASRRPLRLTALGLFAGIAGLGGLILISNYPGNALMPSLPPSSIAMRLPDVIGENVLSGLAALFGSIIALSPVWIVVLLLCAAGIWEGRRQRVLILLGGWAILHLVVLGVLQVGVMAWSFAPLAPLIAGLAGTGTKRIAERAPYGVPRTATWAVACVVIVAAGIQAAIWLAYASPAQSTGWPALAGRRAEINFAEVANWLSANTPPDAVVGARSVGTLGYLSGRPMVEYYGALTPGVADAVGRGDGGWWIRTLQPDYLVLSAGDFQQIESYSPATDEWFSQTYREASRFPDSAMLIFQRTAERREMRESLISFVAFGGGITLNGIASDFNLEPLEGGRLSLMRLEWILDHPVAETRMVSIRIQARDGGAVAGLQTQTLDFSRWPARKLATTFHSIQVAQGLPPGVYDVQIGVGATEPTLDWKTVGRAKVPFVGTTDLGGISGAHTEFGDIELIGYRVGRRDAGLEVLLLWRAIHAPNTDYRVLYQVRDQTGAVVSQQAIQPMNGVYPTSVWSAGEQVTDSVLLDISAVPAGQYEVYIGLLTADERHLLTLDGSDSVFIGRVNIEP